MGLPEKEARQYIRGVLHLTEKFAFECLATGWSGWFTRRHLASEPLKLNNLGQNVLLLVYRCTKLEVFSPMAAVSMKTGNDDVWSDTECLFYGMIRQKTMPKALSIFSKKMRLADKTTEEQRETIARLVMTIPNMRPTYAEYFAASVGQSEASPL